MEKVRPWCDQPSDRGRLKNRNRGQVLVQLSTYTLTTCIRRRTSLLQQSMDCRSGSQQQLATAGLLLWAQTGTDARTPDRSVDPATHSMRAVPITDAFHYYDPQVQMEMRHETISAHHSDCNST